MIGSIDQLLVRHGQVAVTQCRDGERTWQVAHLEREKTVFVGDHAGVGAWYAYLGISHGLSGSQAPDVTAESHFGQAR